MCVKDISQTVQMVLGDLEEISCAALLGVESGTRITFSIKHGSTQAVASKMYESSIAVGAFQPTMADLSVVILPERRIATTLIVVGVVGANGVVFPIMVPIAIIGMLCLSSILFFVGYSGGSFRTTLCTDAGLTADPCMIFFQKGSHIVKIKINVVHPLWWVCSTLFHDGINMGQK
jgi:hypothetical protein